MPGLDDQAFISAFGGRWPGKEALVRRTPTLAERETFRTALQDQYEARVRKLAESVADGRIGPRQFQVLMDKATSQYLIRQQAIGAGTTRMDTATLQTLDAQVRRQQAYLSRFVDQIGGRIAIDKPMSAAQIGNRAAGYSDAGRAIGIRAQEGSTRADAGYLWEYQAQDDGGTCGPCLEAEGLYADGEGPIPGEVCLGRGNCRCTRELVYRPDVTRVA